MKNICPIHDHNCQYWRQGNACVVDEYMCESCHALIQDKMLFVNCFAEKTKEVKSMIDFTKVRDEYNGLDIFSFLNGAVLTHDELAQLIHDNPYVQMKYCGFCRGFEIWEIMSLETGCIIWVKEATL